MVIDTTLPRTRRAILLGALGASAASVAAAVGRANPVSAVDDEAVVVGGEYVANSVTKFDASRSGDKALWGDNDNYTGVMGSSISYLGVYGLSDSSIGVQGQSTSSWGVFGLTSATDTAAVLGWAVGDSTAVQGSSGAGYPSFAAPAKTGVYGVASQDAKAVGVNGHSELGTGGLFSAGATGVSLRATGRVKLDKAAGVATIAAATNSVTVTPGVDLVSTSAVVATLQGIPSGTALVKSVAVNATANTFTIYLSANATHVTKVAWHVFG